MDTEKSFEGHGNYVAKILKKKNYGETVAAAQDLSAATEMTLTLSGVTITSDNGAADPIRWAKAGYATGEVRFFLSGLGITPGTYRAWLVVYDPTYPTGEVWDVFPVMHNAEVEAS